VEESEGPARVVDFEKDRSFESEDITNSSCIPELRADLCLTSADSQQSGGTIPPKLFRIQNEILNPQVSGVIDLSKFGKEPRDEIQMPQYPRRHSEDDLHGNHGPVG
jgi:hypothetical protein